jgi:hypothetical protein
LSLSAELREPRTSAEASELVTIPRAELEAQKHELKLMRRKAVLGAAKYNSQADPGPGDDAPTFTREELASCTGPPTA